MSGAPKILTVHELEALLARAEEATKFDPDSWASRMVHVCRQALAQAAEIEALRNPPSPRMVPCPRCQGKHVCVGSEPGLCEFPCYGCNCTGKVKEVSC